MNVNYEKVLWEYICLSEKIINKDELIEVKHFYEHDEFEMALEGLLIELIESGISSENFNLFEMKNLIIHYGLNNEFNFDELIWNKYLIWSNDR